MSRLTPAGHLPTATLHSATPTPAIDPDPQSPLDFEVLQDLRAMAGDDAEDLLTEVIELYFQDAPQRLSAIHSAIQAADAAALAQAAHALRSLSAVVGARRVAICCQPLETCSNAGMLRESIGGAIEHWSQLIDAYEQATVLLARELPGKPND